jgi:hypothetical protein
VKRYKFPATDKILAQLSQSGGNTLCSKIHKLITSIWNKVELLQQWKELYLFIKTMIELTVVANYRGTSLLTTTHKVLSNIFLSRLTPYADELTGDNQ